QVPSSGGRGCIPESCCGPPPTPTRPSCALELLHLVGSVGHGIGFAVELETLPVADLDLPAELASEHPARKHTIVRDSEPQRLVAPDASRPLSRPWGGGCIQVRFAYSPNSPKSSDTHGSSPTISASWPGGMAITSPGPTSNSEPSSI